MGTTFACVIAKVRVSRRAARGAAAIAAIAAIVTIAIAGRGAAARRREIRDALTASRIERRKDRGLSQLLGGAVLGGARGRLTPGRRVGYPSRSSSGNSSAVERHLAKVDVAGSIPVSRSNLIPTLEISEERSSLVRRSAPALDSSKKSSKVGGHASLSQIPRP